MKLNDFQWSVLNIKKFRAWLESHAPDNIIGLGGTASDCPMAVYLREQGIRAVVVDWFPGKGWCVDVESVGLLPIPAVAIPSRSGRDTAP